MKKLLLILPLVFLFCFTFGCQDKEAMAELEEFKAQAEVEEQNKALLRKALEAWSKGDLEAFKGLLAPEYFYYSPSISTKPKSREGMIEFGKMLHNAFDDVTFSIVELFAAEDVVMSRFIMRATHTGEWEGIPATGNKVESSAMLITRIENGKVVEDLEEFDVLGFMQQLGMELKPKEKEK